MYQPHLTEVEQKTRAAYMAMWVSRKQGHGAYSIQMLRTVLLGFCDVIVADLLDKKHIVQSSADGYSLTDEGVRTWAVMATSTSSVNSFDPELKIWANWIMTIDDLLRSLDQDFKPLARHVDYPVIKKAKAKGWIEISGNVQRLKQYRITEAGLAHFYSRYLLFTWFIRLLQIRLLERALAEYSTQADEIADALVNAQHERLLEEYENYRVS